MTKKNGKMRNYQLLSRGQHFTRAILGNIGPGSPVDKVIVKLQAFSPNRQLNLPQSLGATLHTQPNGNMVWLQVNKGIGIYLDLEYVSHSLRQRGK